MRLLLHTCCGPCLAGCLRGLEGEVPAPLLFWYNPNIHPWTEYRSRRDCLEAFAKEKKLELLKADEYGLRGFLRGLENDYESGDRRCGYCYRLRLERTAETARDLGCDCFSTTLLTSPYQRHWEIKKTGEELAARFGVAFFYRDLRPFFQAGRQSARQGGLYMQKYCGCVFSEEERYAP
ncbi:MAG: epoxyqueuosine reductase QueH [Treponema sp.]|jgi:predicted adenine nucleotide alpha hydrolase (AANH) superfamily ATPase|nr:epoxyqueuosine reductase QueH [Treponema sp.]